MTDPRKIALMIADVIGLHPERWDQEHWMIPVSYRPFAGDIAASLQEQQGHSCGSTACVAGWAAILAAPPGTRVSPENIWLPDGSAIGLGTAGALALGLEPGGGRANWLFYSYRSREQVLAALAAIAAGGDWDPADITRDGWDA